MKKLLSMIMLLVMVLSLCQTVALAEDAKVEISFCVGDSTLIINGKEVSVEKPYVVGAGVTLVPVRVITEAFGAEVNWDKITKTVKLEFNGTELILQIGNPIARINGAEKELLSAPELTPNGFTMVPIRFISENFGAVVGYDNTTKRVSVTGERKESSSIVWSVETAGGKNILSSDGFGISIELPCGFEIASGEANELVIESTSADRSVIVVNIYSKSSVTSSGFLGQQVIKENKSRYNMSAVATDTELSSASYNNFKGLEYRGKVVASELEGTIRNVFFENGDFVYNIGIFADASAKEADIIAGVLNSVSLTNASLPAENYGRKAKGEFKSVTVNDVSKCRFEIPENFALTEKKGIKIDIKGDSNGDVRSDKSVIYTDGKVTLEARKISFDFSDSKQKEDAFEGYIKLDDIRNMFLHRFTTNIYTEIENEAGYARFGDNNYVSVKLLEDGEDYILHHEVYTTEVNDFVYMFCATYPEIHYSADNRAVVNKIMRSIELESKKK